MSWGPAPLWAGPVSVGKGRPGDVGGGEKGKRLAGGAEEKLGSLDSSGVLQLETHCLSQWTLGTLQASARPHGVRLSFVKKLPFWAQAHLLL